MIIKKIQGLADRQIQDIVYVFASIGDLQYRFFEAPALAIGAGDKHIRKKLHFDLFKSVAIAGLTPSAVDIEGKITRSEAFGAGRIGIGQQPADGVKGLGVSQCIGSRGPADGTLVDQNHIIDVSDPADFLVPAGSVPGITQGAFGRFVKDLFCQGGFAGSGYARQTDKQPQGNGHIYVF